MNNCHPLCSTGTGRRAFIITVAASGAALVATRAGAQPAPGPKLTESDPQAVALGYKEDTTKVDNAKFPKHTPDQHCGGCQFFVGKPTDAMAPCTLFANKQVMNKGWCSAYNKKA